MMLRIAAAFAGLMLLLALPAFVLPILPILALCAKLALVAALVGFVTAAIALAVDEYWPLLNFDLEEVHP